MRRQPCCAHQSPPCASRTTATTRSCLSAGSRTRLRKPWGHGYEGPAGSWSQKGADASSASARRCVRRDHAELRTAGGAFSGREQGRAEGSGDVSSIAGVHTRNTVVHADRPPLLSRGGLCPMRANRTWRTGSSLVRWSGISDPRPVRVSRHQSPACRRRCGWSRWRCSAPSSSKAHGTGACLAAPGIEKLPDNVLKRTGRSVTTW